MATNPAGNGAKLDVFSNHNTLSQSTFTSVGVNFYGLQLNNSSSNTITGFTRPIRPDTALS